MDPKRKSQLGQFFTPASIARFMAEMFDRGGKGDCRLLDPGAGIGSLSAAFLERWASGGFNFQRIELDAFEIDDLLEPYLSQTLKRYGELPGFVPLIRNVDFVHAAADSLSGNLFAAALPATWLHARDLKPTLQKNTKRLSASFRIATSRY